MCIRDSINTAFGSAPSCLEIATPIGHSRAADAVLDINCVKPQAVLMAIAVAASVSYTHLDVYKRQVLFLLNRYFPPSLILP